MVSKSDKFLQLCVGRLNQSQNLRNGQMNRVGVLQYQPVITCHLITVILILQGRQMSASPPKLDSTYYRSVRSPPSDHSLKRHVQHFKLEQRNQRSRNYQSKHSPEYQDRRLQVVLNQNSILLTENAQLSELIAQKIVQMQILEGRLRDESMPSAFNSQQSLLYEIQAKDHKHVAQIRHLMAQIEFLNIKCADVQTIKNREIQLLQQECTRDTLAQVVNLRRSQTSSNDLYQLQIKQLKGELESRRNEQDQAQRRYKNQTLKLSGNNSQIVSQFKRAKQVLEIQISQLKRGYEERVSEAKREEINQKQITSSFEENVVRKVKRQLADKQTEIQQLNSKLQRIASQHQSQVLDLARQSTKLRLYNELMGQQSRQQLNLLKSKAEEMTNKEITSLLQTKDILLESLKSEVSKLYQVSECKSVEIRNLREKQELERQNQKSTMDKLENQNKELKSKMSQSQLQFKSEIETLKIKMSEIHYSQVDHLQKYVQNEVSVLNEHILAQEKIIEDNRTKLHLELQAKNQIRKHYEIELSKQKAKVIDLKVKLAATSVEMKEQMVSMTSRMELTSQTLIREAGLKEKGQVFLQEQKRKLQVLITSKDKQIFLLNEELNGLKREHILETTDLEEYIRQLKNMNQEVEALTRKESAFYEGEIKRKQGILQSKVQSLQQELMNLKKAEYDNVRSEIESLQRENIKLSKQLENEARDHKFKAHEANLKNGFIQSMQLESSAALEDQRSKYYVLVNKNQTTLKGFFQQKVSLKNKEISGLQQQLTEKDSDLREIIAKYKELQKKLSLAMQSIQKLSDLQNRVLNLGMDNNLVKNLSELFRHRS